MKWIKLVVLLNILVLKCWAMTQMTRSELDDFSDFIEKTAQLDLNLKSNPDDDADDDETLSENAWEQSGKFEGDLILNERQRRLIVEDVAEGLSRNGLRDSTKRWPDNEVIYYIQREHFSEDQLQAIQNGIDDIAQASCVKFKPYKKGDRDAVVIQGSRRGCFSQVGYQGGYQVLNLYGRHPVGRGCFRHGTVVHEFLHTLGFYHMQSSPDRDDYIDVIWENIHQPAKHNFRKYNTFAVSDFGVGYDYDSVLHYSPKAFSSNGKDTLIPKQNGADIGQRVGLSQKDTEKLNKMYCDAESNNDDLGSRVFQRIPNKKKVTKNKPFEGHGIGYHQGKTVVIKLPAAETYRLPVLSTSHIFDYFSKAPQAVSKSLFENNGFGRGIASSHDKATPIPVQKPAILVEESPEKNNISEISQEISRDNVSIVESVSKKDNGINSQENVESEISSQEESDHNKTTVDIRSEFDKLNKVIKNHVYPPEHPGDYKVKNYYNEDLKMYPEFSVLRPDAEKEVKKQSYGVEDPSYFIFHRPKYVIETEDTLNNKKRIQNNDFSGEMGSNLNHRHNYDNLYLPKENSENSSQHKLFGEHVPTNEDWNKNDELKRHTGKYDISSYSEENENMPTADVNKLTQNHQMRPEYESSLYSSPYSKQEHLLFGVPVPLTKPWYKIHNGNDAHGKHVFRDSIKIKDNNR